jgi:cytidyltransferase-like protein
MKIISYPDAEAQAKKIRTEGKTIALVTGCFDVLHTGHINFFQFAKTHADCLFVGIDNDENIRLNKGENRPLFNIKQRLMAVALLENVDYVFEIVDKVKFNSLAADIMLAKIISDIKPNFLVCHKIGDPALNRKAILCRKSGTRLLIDRSSKVTSSTILISNMRNNSK